MNSTASPSPNASTTPIAESRSRARCPRTPNSTAAKPQPTSAPTPTLKPASSAKAAPVSDNSDDPCTANDIRRITMNGPINPDTRASSAAANNACWTKSRCSKSPVMSNEKRLANRSVSRSLMVVSARVSRVVEVLADDDVSFTDLDHLDVGAVELGQRRRRHHLFDGSDAESAVDQIEHSIHILQNRIHLVRDEQHGGAGLAAAMVDQRGHQAGVGRVEVQKRLVAE